MTIACSKKLFFHSSRVSESFGNLSETLSLITNMKTKKYLSTKEAAELLGVDPRTILHRIQRNEINAHKSGKTWKIEYDSIKDQEELVSETSEHFSDTSETFRKDDDAFRKDNDNAELIEHLKSEVTFLREELQTTKERSDTIIMQLSQQIDRQQLQLEDMRRNRSIFARIRDVFVPSST